MKSIIHRLHWVHNQLARVVTILWLRVHITVLHYLPDFTALVSIQCFLLINQLSVRTSEFLLISYRIVWFYEILYKIQEWPGFEPRSRCNSDRTHYTMIHSPDNWDRVRKWTLHITISSFTACAFSASVPRLWNSYHHSWLSYLAYLPPYCCSLTLAQSEDSSVHCGIWLTSCDYWQPIFCWFFNWLCCLTNYNNFLSLQYYHACGFVLMGFNKKA